MQPAMRASQGRGLLNYNYCSTKLLVNLVVPQRGSTLTTGASTGFGRLQRRTEVGAWWELQLHWNATICAKAGKNSRSDLAVVKCAHCKLRVSQSDKRHLYCVAQ